MRAITAAVLVLAALGLAQAQVSQVKLNYDLSALEPHIDAKTMGLHYGTHYKGYVDNLNKATSAAGAPVAAKSADLSSLVKATSTYTGDLATAVRNQGGGAWNHALYFKHLAPAGSANTDPAKSLSPDLSAAINQAFGSLDKMKAEVADAGVKRFGSGWSWLCAAADGKLAVTSTPNQDNPLMGSLPNMPPVKHAGCTPILGLDVWEHAYYLKHGPKRAAYITDFWAVVDWKQVSANYRNAKAGKVQALVA